MQVRRSETLSKLETDLVDLLESHDWFYDYSDDSTMWYRGNKQAWAIMTLVKQLGQSGVDLYNQYAPEKIKDLK